MMTEQIRVSDTLAVEMVEGRDPHVTVERDGGGLVRVEPCELVKLAVTLVGISAALEAQRDVATVWPELDHHVGGPGGQ